MSWIPEATVQLHEKVAKMRSEIMAIGFLEELQRHQHSGIEITVGVICS